MWAAFAAAFYVYFRSVADLGVATWLTSIATGLVVSMAVLLLHSVFTAGRERTMLIEAATGETPQDGKRVAVSGEIRSRTPVRGPISGEPVVAYEYTISRDEKLGRNSSEVTWYDGKALAASTIATRHGAIRLLSVPRLDIEAASVEPETALRNAMQHVRTATFARRDTPNERTSLLEQEWTDDDGVYQIDRRHFGAEVDLADRFRFQEQHLEQGAMVCAFGVYSKARGGLVPDEQWGGHTTVMRGSALDVAAQLRSRMVRYSVGAVVLLAVAATGAALYVQNAR